MFTMCGNANTAHPDLRCELNARHTRSMLGEIRPNLVRHRSGNVIWDGMGNHRHLSKIGLALHKVQEKSAAEAIDGQPSIEVTVSSFIPDGQAYLFDPTGQSRFSSVFASAKTVADEVPFWGDGPSGMTADPKPPTPAEQLAGWWREKAEAEIDQTVAKAVEYGSTDLIDIGHSIARAAGRELEGDDEAAEWGIFFYLEGKLSRWRSAITDGRRVSDDTLLDIGVYARMAQRVRDAGGWPGTEEDDE